MLSRIAFLLPSREFFISTLFLFLIIQFGYAQETQKQTAPEIVLLELNKIVGRKFANESEKRIYQISLKTNQYMIVTIEQRGIDVTASLIAVANGKPIAQFDDDPRLQGRENIELIAKDSGNYQIIVAPKYKNIRAGEYEITLTALRSSDENDRLRQDASEMAANAAKLAQAKKFDESIAEADRALAALEKAGETKSLLYSLVIRREGNIFFDRGDYPKAEAYYLRSAKAAENAFGISDPRTSAAYNNLAVLYNIIGNYEKSEIIFQQILANQEKAFGENYPAIVIILNNFGNLYRRKGNYAKAETMHLRSLAIREKIYGFDQPELLYPLAGLATVYYEKKDFLKSKEVDERALKIAEKSYGQDDPRLMIYLNNLALADTELGDYAQAEPMFKRALAISEKAYGENSIDLAGPLNNLGELYAYTGDYDKSNLFYERTLKIREKFLPANHPEIAGTLGNIASNYLFRGEYAKAEPLLQKQLTMREASLGSDHPDVAKTLNSLARLYENEGDVAQAVSYQSRVDKLLEQYNRLNLYAGSEKQELAYFDYLAQQTDQLLSMQFRFPENEAVRNLAVTAVLQRKGRVQDILADSLSALRRRFAPNDQKLLSDLSETNSQLAEIVTGGLSKENQSDRQEKIKQLTERKETLEGEISRLSAGFYRQESSLTLDALQQKIPSDAVLLEFAVYHPFHLKASTAKNQYEKPRYVAYVIHKEGSVGFKELGDAGQIDEAIDALRTSLRDLRNKDTLQISRAGSEKIIEPIRALLGDAKHLLISPDGALNLIPFEALVDENNHYLIENYSFTYLTSGRDLLRMQKTGASQNKSLIITNPSFGEPPEQTIAVNKTRKTSNRSKRQSITATRNMSDIYFAPLSGTIQEARSIQALFPDAEFLTGTQATESALKQAVAPRILHIATHGFFLQDDGNSENNLSAATRSNVSKTESKIENPLLRSGLALAGANEHSSGDDDGVLTALEASGLNLWGTKLVVLSACDTGLGEVKNGEGVYGLRRAFTLAGAESLVMSLWSVSDYTTRELMTNYYKNLKQGIGRGGALREVQLEMMKRKGREHPFYWAAFIESGEWANLDGKR